MPNFLAALRAKQESSELDRDFARRLGVSRAHWTRVRRGERPVTVDLALRAALLWPELAEVYLEDHREEFIARLSSAAAAQAAQENPPEV